MTILFLSVVLIALALGLAATLAYSLAWTMVALGWIAPECARFSEGPLRYLELWAEPWLLLGMVLAQVTALVWVIIAWCTLDEP